MLRAIRNNFPDRKPELWRRLVPSLWNQARLRFVPAREAAICAIRGGLRMQVDSRDPMGKAIYLYGCYDYPVTRLIETLAGPGKVFFDIGANVGFFSLLAAEKQAQVFAFEPLPSNIARLRRNLEINALPNVTVIEKAVGDSQGTAALFVPESQNSGLASLSSSVGGNAMQVPIITLDGFIWQKKLPRVDLIKIDIEGAEVQAFAGAQELLSSSGAPDVIFEAHPGSEAAEWLRAHGYRIYEFTLQREWEARNLFATKRALNPQVAKQVRALKGAK